MRRWHQPMMPVHSQPEGSSMSSSRPGALYGLLIVIVAAAGSAAGQSSQRELSGEGLPDGPGKDVTVQACAPCHEARRAASVRLTRDGWAAVIDSMQKRGAKVSAEEFPIILDYLTTHFLGEALQPLNLNTASQIDLEAAGGLLRREAAAVIRYREQNGRFKTLDDLKQVPGLDFKKLENRRDAIVVM
jgi:competence protein ComEA